MANVTQAIQQSQTRPNHTFSPEMLEAIRSASPIAPIIAGYVYLRRAGKELAGKCPFHDERTSSFYVNREGFFHCFGCQAGGDVFDFIQLLLKCTFPEAVKHLATRAGVAIQGFKPSAELMKRVAAEKAKREEEQAFKKFCNDRLNVIGARYRALGRSATHAEEYLCSGLPDDPYLHDLAWSAIERFRRFEASIEREGLCDLSVLREEWLAKKGAHVAA